MNYNKAYKNLLEKHGSKQKPEGYSERHHILPKCMGGSDEDDNLTYLSARAHYIAHAMLFFIHRSPKLARAWFGMCDIHRKPERKITARQYEEAKKAFSKYHFMKEEGYRQKASENAKRQWSEGREKMIASNAKIFKDPNHGMYMKGKTGFNHPRGRSVVTPLGTFGSVREAGRAHNVRHPAISKKCRNKAYPNYYYTGEHN
jgi:hypothetical protein